MYMLYTIIYLSLNLLFLNNKFYTLSYHNPRVGGSSPSPATKNFLNISNDSRKWPFQPPLGAAFYSRS